MSEWFDDTVTFANPESGDLFQKLVDCGIIHSVDIIRPNGEIHTLDNVLDYALCSKEEAEKYKAEVIKKGGKEYSEKAGKFVRVNLTPDQVEEAMLMPVSKPEDVPGGVRWFCKRVYETPLKMIAAKFPDEVFAFREYYSHYFSCSYHYNNKGLCTKDGKHLDAWLTSVKGKQIKFQDENTAKISVSFNNTDKYFAKIYLPKFCVLPQDFKEGYDITPEKRFDICVENKDKQIMVYRTLENGDFKKEPHTWEELREILKTTKEEWRKNNPRQNQTQRANQEINTDDYPSEDIELEG
jgi:hypothetical protein